MPKSYSTDLRWRIIWFKLTNQNLTMGDIATTFNVCERTVRRYVQHFQQTGEVEYSHIRHGPKLLLGEFEQLTLLRLVLDNPGIYLREIVDKLRQIYGITISMSTICRTLRIMGCSRQAMHRVARYSAIPIISTAGIHDVYLAEGNVNGWKFCKFVEECLLPMLNPFNGINPHSVVIMDNASIHHVDEVYDLIEGQAGARLVWLLKG